MGKNRKQTNKETDKQENMKQAQSIWWICEKLAVISHFKTEHMECLETNSFKRTKFQSRQDITYR